MLLSVQVRFVALRSTKLLQSPFFIPVAAVQLDGVLNALATVAALQIVFFAVFVATPADTLGIFGKMGNFLGHDVLLLFVCGMGRIISD